MTSHRSDSGIWHRRHARFRRELADYLESLGAVPTPLGYHEWAIETPLGVLEVSADKYSEGIQCRFAEPTRAARSGIGCNPANGRWNFAGRDFGSALDGFRAALDALIRGPEQIQGRKSN